MVQKLSHPGRRWWSGVSLAELTLFSFLASGLVVFIAAWLAFHLLTAQAARHNQFHNQAELDSVAHQLDSVIQRHTAAVEVLARYPKVARLLLNSDRRVVSNEEIELGALFPDALRVSLLQPGAMGLDVGAFPRLGAADLEMMKKIELQSLPPPLEAHLPGTPQEHFDIARPINGADGKIIGHFLVTFDKAFLQQTLDSLPFFRGYAEIHQEGSFGSTLR